MIIIQSLAGGGAERVAAELSQVISTHSNVFIVVFDKEVQYNYSGELICLKTRKGPRFRFFGKLLNTWSYIRQLKRIKKQKEIDISISHMPDADLVNAYAKGHDKRIGMIHHNPNTEIMSKNWHYYLRRRVLRKMDKVITPSEGARGAAISRYGIKTDKIKTIYNPCDVDYIRQASPDLAFRSNNNIKPDDYCIVTMGSMRYEKAQWHLIKAFRVLHEKNLNTKLVVIGDGKYRDKLDGLVKNLGLQDAVVFTGHLNEPFSVLAVCDAFVLTSNSESFANVIIEAMASGLPCICSDCDFGPREILGECTQDSVSRLKQAGYGILVPAFDLDEPDFSSNISDKEKGLAKAVSLLIDNRDIGKQYKIKGNNRVDSFTTRVFGEKWNSLIFEEM